MSDFDYAWFGLSTVPEGFRMDVNADIHEGPFVVLVCDRCPRPAKGRRVGAWGQSVDLRHVVTVARVHVETHHDVVPM